MNILNYIAKQCKKHPSGANTIIATCLAALFFMLGKGYGEHSVQLSDVPTESPTPTATHSKSSTPQIYQILDTDTSGNTASQISSAPIKYSVEQQQIQDILQYANSFISQKQSPFVNIQIQQGDKKIPLTIKNFPSTQSLTINWEDNNAIYKLIFNQGKLFQREITVPGGTSYSGTDLSSTFPKFLLTSPKGIFNLAGSENEKGEVKEQQTKLLKQLQQLLASYKTTHLYFH